MTEQELEQRLQDAFAHATPDVLDAVLSDCEGQKGTVIVMTEQKKTAPWRRRMAGMAAALALLVTGTVGYQVYQTNYTVDSTVSLDVNPSIEIRVNQKEKVLEVVPLNQDGKTVVGNMDFSGSSLDMTVNALIGSMLRNGYLSELSNSILVSVDNGDPLRGSALQEKLAGEINTLLQVGSFQGAVLSQTVSDDDALRQLAAQNGVTTGKAQLIQELMARNPLYSFEALAALSINELNLLSSSQGGQLTNVSAVGTASDKAYIGVEKAKSLALNHAGVAAANATFTEAKLDADDGIMVYEVEFYAAGLEYDYEVDAVSGAIRKSDQERDDDHPTGGSAAVSPPTVNGTTAPATPNGISEARAKEIALSHAGVAAGDVWAYQVDLDNDDGVWVYDIDFKALGNEYDYEIVTSSGKVRKSDKERDDDSVPASTGTTGGSTSTGNSTATSTGSAIGESRAKEIALGHAGVAAGDIRNYHIELDRDDGVAKYELQFRVGSYEYDYEIQADNGSILHSEKEQDD